MDSFIHGRVCVITPAYRQIDVMNSDRFSTELEERFDGEHDVILDLSKVLFLDSSALGKIVTFLRAIREARREMVFCGMNDAVTVLFRMVRLSQIAKSVPTLREAFDALGAPPPETAPR